MLEFEPERIEGIAESAVSHLSDGRIELSLEIGDEVTFFAKQVKEATVSPVEAKQEDCNSFGLN